MQHKSQVTRPPNQKSDRSDECWWNEGECPSKITLLYQNVSPRVPFPTANGGLGVNTGAGTFFALELLSNRALIAGALEVVISANI
jgi:hypothetical protein